MNLIIRLFQVFSFLVIFLLILYIAIKQLFMSLLDETVEHLGCVQKF